MDSITVFATLIFVCLAAGFGVVFARLISRDRLNFPAEEGDDLFSPTRYKAMERLLDETDEKFLKSQLRFDRQTEKKFRATRIKIFRGYMHQLSADFERVSKAVKVLMVQSKTDRPDLAGLLMKQQFTFTFAIMTVECKLFLYGLGWRGVDAKALVEPLIEMRSQLQLLAGIANPAAAMHHT